MGKMDRVDEMLETMKDKRVELDMFVYSTVLNGYIENQQYDQAQKLLTKILQLHQQLPVELKNTILKMFHKIGDIKSLEQFFREMEQSGDVDSISYTILLSAFSANKSFDQATNVCDGILASKIRISQELWNAIINAYLEANNMEKIDTIFSQMKRIGKEPDVVTYTMLLNKYIDYHLYDKAQELLNKLPYQKNVKLWTTIIRLYCKLGDMGQAEQALRDMKAQSLEPDLITYNTMLNGYIDQDMFEQAQAIHMEAEAKIKGDKPVEYWNTVIKMFCKLKLMKNVEQILQQIELDDVTRTIVLNGYIDSGMYSDAQKLVSATVSPGNLQLWNSIIKLHGKMGNMEKAKQVFEQMVESVTSPSENTYVTLLNGYIENMMLDKALEIYNTLDVHSIQSVELWGTVIKLFCKMNRIKQAEQLFRIMQSTVQVGLMGYHQLLQGYVENGLRQKAIAFYDEIIRTHTPDEYTFNIMLQGVDNILHDDYLSEIILRLNESGLKKTKRIFSTLIVQHFAVNQPEKALEYLKELQASGITLDLETFAVLISNSQSLGFVLENINKYQNVQLSMVERSMLIMCYGLVSEFSKALMLFQEKRSTTNIELWRSMLFACFKTGNGVVATQLLHDMMLNMVPQARDYMYTILSCSYDAATGSNEAYKVYRMAVEKGYVNKYVHGAMIDAYARDGELEKAELLLRKLNTTDKVYWITLYGGCKKYADFDRIKRLEQEFPHLLDSVEFVMLSHNIAAISSQYAEQEAYSAMKVAKKMKKIPGVSSVVKDGKVVSFRAGDIRATKEAKQWLKSVQLIMESSYGYQPKLDCVTNNSKTREGKIANLLSHSEKLATAYMVTESSDETIIIFKNLRICEDCHEFIRLLSTITGRRLVINDRSLSHEFSNGKCSCNGKY
jgi:pentatricopeptide repeat protein